MKKIMFLIFSFVFIFLLESCSGISNLKYNHVYAPDSYYTPSGFRENKYKDSFSCFVFLKNDTVIQSYKVITNQTEDVVFDSKEAEKYSTKSNILYFDKGDGTNIQVNDGYILLIRNFFGNNYVEVYWDTGIIATID